MLLQMGKTIKTLTETEDKVVKLYVALVKPSKISEDLSMHQTTVHRILKRRGIASDWKGRERLKRTHSRCTKCDEVKPVCDFPKAPSSYKFSKIRACCKVCTNAAAAAWMARNIDKCRKGQRDRMNYLRKSDPQFRIMLVVRSKVIEVLKRTLAGGYKKRPTTSYAVDVIGCSMEHLISHLESQFKSGMSWANHTRTGWHIDHKIPYRQFDLRTLDGLKAWYHWTNLQPLWADENKRKGNKLNYVLP